MEKEEIKKEVLNFLNNHRKAIVAIVGGDGKPTTSLMLYVIDDDLNVFFGTRKSFGKYSALNNNPNVSLTVIQEKLDPLQAVDVRGRVEFVPEEDTEKTLSFFESKEIDLNLDNTTDPPEDIYPLY